MIHIDDKHFEILKSILCKAKIKFYAFGSRVKGTHQKFSDLDICYKEELEPEIRRNIKFDIEDSNLPFFVDIVDYNKCSDDFKKIIDQDGIEIDLN